MTTLDEKNEDLPAEDHRQIEALDARLPAGAGARPSGHPRVAIVAALTGLFATWLLTGGLPEAAWQSYVDFRAGESLWAGKVFFFLIVFIAMLVLELLATLLTAVYDYFAGPAEVWLAAWWSTSRATAGVTLLVLVGTAMLAVWSSYRAFGPLGAVGVLPIVIMMTILVLWPKDRGRGWWLGMLLTVGVAVLTFATLFARVGAPGTT